MNEKLKEFEALAKPLNEWLQKNFNPHAIIFISNDGAELLSGELGCPFPLLDDEEIEKKKVSKLFSIAEQHTDGKYWYHPGQTYNSWDEANKAFIRIYGDIPRPYRILEHEHPFPQENSLYSNDCVIWGSMAQVMQFELK